MTIARHIETVARELLGDPNPQLSKRAELRYGSRGSLSVDLAKGTWFDHEAGEGGGVLDLIARETGLANGAAVDWLRAEGFDISGDAQTGTGRQIVASYSYVDERGELLFEVVRFAPKDFRQRRPDPSSRDGWSWKLGDVRRVLYRLPQILEAPEGSVVLFVEGEKDVDRLASLGLIATTSPQGAGSWRDELAEPLRCFRVVAIADNDERGEKHAADVVASCRKRGIPAAVLRLDGLPPKGDVSDWLDAGGTPEGLSHLAAGALTGASGEAGAEGTKRGFELVRVSDLTFEKPEFIVEGVIEASCMALMFGDPGCMKSFIAIDLAASVATGTPFHGRATKQAPVVYIAGEGKGGLKRRTVAWERLRGVPLDNAPLFFSRVAARFLDADSAQAVADAVDAVAERDGPPGLIVIDTLSRNFGPGDENSTNDMPSFIAAVDELKDRYGATALIVHHTGHQDKGRARGNSSLRAALDAEYRIELDGSTVTMTSTKMKDAAPPSPITLAAEQVEIAFSPETGEIITSLALAEIARNDRPARQRLTPAQRLGTKTFMEALQGKGDISQSLSVEEWRPFFYAAHTADSAHAKKMAFQRARQSLVEAGELTVHEDVYRFVGTYGATP